VTQTTIAASTVYDEFLAALGKPRPDGCILDARSVSYRTTPVASYKRPQSTTRRRVGQQLPGGYRFEAVPIDNSDVAFRSLNEDLSNNAGSASVPVLETVGEFDPSKLPGFGSLSQVPWRRITRRQPPGKRG